MNPILKLQRYLARHTALIVKGDAYLCDQLDEAIATTAAELRRKADIEDDGSHTVGDYQRGNADGLRRAAYYLEGGGRGNGDGGMNDEDIVVDLSIRLLALQERYDNAKTAAERRRWRVLALEMRESWIAAVRAVEERRRAGYL